MEAAVTAAKAAVTVDEGISEVAAWLVVDDETAAELSMLLDLYEAPPPPFKVRFIENPYSSPMIVQSSSSYVTINGNEESCGSSFSDSDSSFMASIDLGGGGACAVGARGWRSGEADVDMNVGGFFGDGVDCREDGDDATWLEFLGGIFD